MAKPEKPNFYEITTYLQKLSDRISEIEAQSKSVVADSNIKNNSFQKTTYSIKAEVVQIRRVAESAKEIIEKQKRIIKSLVGEFKIIVKEDKFDRLKEKIDNWSPEKLVTRNELKKML